MKLYQVFVSSTYKDLKEERKEVIQALLELDCIPVGMELFPATDNDQWTLIKELIEESDYYILIVGGRYGSLNADGISYTQMEYEYANKIGVPTISFLHKDPDNLPVSKTDKDSEKLELLEKFKKEISTKLIKPWKTPEELGSVVSRSLVKLIKTKPRTGWVKADQISSTEANLEILNLREKVQKLEEELKEYSNLDQEGLSKGEDEVQFTFHYKLDGKFEQERITLVWNDLFSKTCSILLDESTENEYKNHVDSYIDHILTMDDERDKKLKNRVSVGIIYDDFYSILIQFKALGLIEKSYKKRSIKDKNSYWKLTKKGDNLLTNLRAIRN